MTVRIIGEVANIACYVYLFVTVREMMLAMSITILAGSLFLLYETGEHFSSEVMMCTKLLNIYNL
jgi:hypothetical protein